MFNDGALMTERSPLTRAFEGEKRGQLSGLADQLIADLTAVAPYIREGEVMTLGPAPYRRLDCDRRALAYVRPRPRKGFVRVDVSGLWLVPESTPNLAHRGSGGSVTLV